MNKTQTEQTLFLGIDIGSTTVKAVILDDKNNILFEQYERHYADIQNKIIGYS